MVRPFVRGYAWWGRGEKEMEIEIGREREGGGRRKKAIEKDGEKERESERERERAREREREREKESKESRDREKTREEESVCVSERIWGGGGLVRACVCCNVFEYFCRLSLSLLWVSFTERKALLQKRPTNIGFFMCVCGCGFGYYCKF